MNKRLLKKELSTFTGEQLVEVILNAYSSSKEVQEYFDFFLNPDADAVLEKRLNLIDKELSKVKYRRCKAKISHIKRTIKGFAALGVPPEYHTRMILETLALFVKHEPECYYPPTLQRGVIALIKEYLTIAQKNSYLSLALEDIGKLYTVDMGKKRRNFLVFLEHLTKLTLEELPNNI